MLSGAALATAIVLGLRLADLRDPRLKRASESRAALAAILGILLMAVATVFWLAYVIFGPLQNALSELIDVEAAAR